MDTHKTFFSPHADWLVERALFHANQQGLALQAQEARASVDKLVRALGQTVDASADADHGLHDHALQCDPITAFAIEAAQLYRKQGDNLGAMLRLFKLYRQTFLDCLAEHGLDADQDHALRATRVFDRLEIALCDNWTQSCDGNTLPEHAISEQNSPLSLLHCLPLPALMLGNNLIIETMNQAAARCLGLAPDFVQAESDNLVATAKERHEHQPLDQIAPWLALSLGEAWQQDRSCFTFQTTAPSLHGEKTYQASVAHIPGNRLVVLLEDATARAEAEQQLARERNRAQYYLDAVGSLVVGLDASGTVTLINRTGCNLLGYEQHELLGRNWIDMVVPEEQQGDIRDYLYSIYTEGIEITPEHVNHIVTKTGEMLLVSWKNSMLRNAEGIPIGTLSSGMDITEQRKTEDALAQKELWLRNTFVALGEAVMIETPDREIIDVNPAAENMFGMDNEDFIDARAELFHVSHNHYIEFGNRAGAAFANGETAHFEFYMRRSNGEIFPTENSISLISGDDGKPLGIVSVIRDISHRKQAESKLKQSEEKFRRIFETIEEGYIVTDLDGDISMVNPATCKLLGYRESELVGHNMALLYHDQKERNEFRKALSIPEGVRGFQVTAKRKDGTTIVMEANAHLILDAEGKPQGMEGTFHDITPRIEAEKAIRESEKQYRAFFENNHAIMLLVEPQTGNIVDANPAANDFYGYSRDDMRTMNIDQINCLSEEEIFKEMGLAHSEKRSYFLFQHKLASSEIRDVEVYSGPIMVHDKQLLYSVIHDVTSRVRLEKEMKTLATTDAMTGANNRHQFFTLAAAELKRAMRYKHPMTVMLMDIDYFKSINDTHGHQAGDVVLKALATAALATLRETDIFGRIGGEEFTAVLPETGLKEGMLVAERLREALAKLTVRAGDVDVTFTVSVGVTLAKRSDKTIEAVLNRADEALYKAKRLGRNRVMRG